MKRLLLPILTLLLIAPALTAARDDAGWPVIERCVGAPTTPPEGWAFEGTLLLTSYRKLHAYQHEWDTPRIIFFFPPDAFDQPGVLSPDGRWFAVEEGDVKTQSVTTLWKTRLIRISSTFDASNITIDWQNTFSAVHSIIGHGLYWLDSEHILHSKGDLEEQWFIINPFSGSTTDWSASFEPSWEIFIPSPDSNKALFTNFSLTYWLLNDGNKEVEIKLWGGGVWHPDSIGFAGYTRDSEQYAPIQFALYDLNGEITEVVLKLPREIVSARNLENGWSSDGDLLLFRTNRLYLADTALQQVIDTCIDVSPYLTTVWSPSNDQIAMIEPYDSSRELQVFDLDKWERYVVAYHSGDVIGWRAD